MDRPAGFSACRLTFPTEIPGAELRQNGAFVQNAITLTSTANERQRALRHDPVRLDDGFWRSFREHPGPGSRRGRSGDRYAVDGAGYLHLAGAYRLHSLSRSTPVTWTALHGQFGAGFKAVRQLKPPSGMH